MSNGTFRYYTGLIFGTIGANLAMRQVGVDGLFLLVGSVMIGAGCGYLLETLLQRRR